MSSPDEFDDKNNRRRHSRAQAKAQIALAWKERRAAKASGGLNGGSSHHEEATTRSSPKSMAVTTNAPPILSFFSNLSLCVLVQKTWDDWIQHLTTNNNRSSKPALESSGRRSRSRTPPPGQKRKSYRKTTFPSVLSILQANALVQQVQEFQNDLDRSDREDDQDASALALQVLPTGYDWNRAVAELTQSRSRVFLLVDLTALMRSIVAWKRRFGEKKVTFWHNVQANGDGKLLQVLRKSGIALATTTKADLVGVTEAVKKSGSAADGGGGFMDATTSVGKPDAYLRELVWTAGVQVIAVDGPDEVCRVRQSLRRMATRRRRHSSEGKSEVNFLLRLPSEETEWQTNLEKTVDAIREGQLDATMTSRLDGLSFSIGTDNLLHDSKSIGECQARIRGLLEWLGEKSDIVNDHGLRIDLTGMPSSCKDPPAEWVDWCTTMLESHVEGTARVREISVEVSAVLVAPAGALCTRLIGVRQQTVQSQQQSETKEGGPEPSSSIRRHYYIDDGCYGSLYQGVTSSSAHRPLPLLPRQRTDKENVSASEDGGTPNKTEVYLSTIWGPTCDGLDKVCHEIPLPLLQRDDWLVFPNLGCCAEPGTAFNGFDPPDTAFCVLGYCQ